MSKMVASSGYVNKIALLGIDYHSTGARPLL